MYNVLKSNILLTILIVVFAVALSEVLIYLQIELFWDKAHDEKVYSIGLWTPLIASIFVAVIILYLKSFYEKELKRKNLILEEAKKIANVAEWEVDIDSMKLKWSDNVFDILGVDKTQEVNFELIKTLIHKDEWKNYETSINDCILGKSDHHCIYKIKKANEDKTIHLESKAKLYRELNLILGTIQDISEQKNTL